MQVFLSRFAVESESDYMRDAMDIRLDASARLEPTRYSGSNLSWNSIPAPPYMFLRWKIMQQRLSLLRGLCLATARRLDLLLLYQRFWGRRLSVCPALILVTYATRTTLLPHSAKSCNRQPRIVRITMDANFLKFGFKSIGEVGEPELLASVSTWPISWSRHFVDPEDIDFAAYVLWPFCKSRVGPLILWCMHMKT